MFAVVVTFEIKSAEFATFMPLMKANAATSLKDEPDCHQFDVCTDPSKPDHVFLYELYTDKAAFDMHLVSPHFIAFSKATSAMITGKTVNTYTEVAQ